MSDAPMTFSPVDPDATDLPVMILTRVRAQMNALPAVDKEALAPQL